MLLRIKAELPPGKVIIQTGPSTHSNLPLIDTVKITRDNSVFPLDCQFSFSLFSPYNMNY